MKIAFFGTPSFALPILDALYERHQVVLVVAQPDKPAGRQRKRSQPPVALRAHELGLPLEQPGKLRGNASFAERLASAAPDVAITAAYGKILPQELLGIPSAGFLNVHASLLPRYRGAAPIQWALLNGETETGVTVMQTDAGLDTGPIRLQKSLAIAESDTAVTLSEKLSRLGATAITSALYKLETSSLPILPQDETQATYAPMLDKDDGRVRWRSTTTEIYNRFRALIPWPGSFTMHGGRRLNIHDLAIAPDRKEKGRPGEIVAIGAEGVSVATIDGAVALREVQPANRKRMRALDWVSGYRAKVGDGFE